MFKGNNKSTRMTSMTSRRRSGVFIEHIPHLFLVFLLLTLNKKMLAGILDTVPLESSCSEKYLIRSEE